MRPPGAGQRRIFRPVRPDWLDRRREPILAPDLPIVDAHLRLWEQPAPGGRYLLGALLADLRTGHRMVATVFMQSGSGYRADGPVALRPVGETACVAGVAAVSAPSPRRRAAAAHGPRLGRADQSGAQ
jgi:hypothetical protein